jgi:hypothetical protein
VASGQKSTSEIGYWTCPTCGRSFARVGQGHVCGRWTVEQQLEGHDPTTLAFYEKFVQLVQACGSFEYAPTRRQIGFQVKRIFAGVHLTKKGLEGYLDMARRVDSPRFSRVSPYTHRLFVHRFIISDASELDDEFAGWVCEAYAVGEGKHLEMLPAAG